MSQQEILYACYQGKSSRNLQLFIDCFFISICGRLTAEKGRFTAAWVAAVVRLDGCGWSGCCGKVEWLCRSGCCGKVGWLCRKTNGHNLRIMMNLVPQFGHIYYGSQNWMAIFFIKMAMISSSSSNLWPTRGHYWPNWIRSVASVDHPQTLSGQCWPSADT